MSVSNSGMEFIIESSYGNNFVNVGMDIEKI